MANIKTRPLFTPLGMITSAIAAQIFENLLERKDLFVPFGDWQDQGVSREEVIESIQKLRAAGFIVTDQDLTHEDFEWEKIAGITLKSLSAKIELSLDQQPELDLEDQKGKKKKKGSKIDHTIPGLDDFTVGLATYRAKIEADPEADAVKLEVIRLSKLDPESDAVDRFRAVLTSHFAGYPKAWEFWESYKAAKLSGEHGVADRVPVRIDDQPITVGIRFYTDGGEFTGMVAIIDVVQDAVLEEHTVNSEHEGYVAFEAFLDRVLPSDAVPEEYQLSTPAVAGGPVEDLDAVALIDPLYNLFGMSVNSLNVDVQVYPHGAGFIFQATYLEGDHLKEKKMSISSIIADEAEAREVADNWLKVIF
jgi:hypothetical protein